MAQDLANQPSERHVTWQIGAIGGDVDAGQHDLDVASLDQSPDLRHDLAGRHRAGGAAAKRNDAERAAMVAAILYLHVGPRPAAEAIDQVAGGLADRHDVVDLHALGLARREPGPGLSMGLLAVAEHMVDLRHGGEPRGLDLRRASRHDDPRRRVLAPGAADGLHGLPHGLGCHRAGIDDDCIAEAGRRCMPAHHLGLVGVEAAAQRDEGRFRRGGLGHGVLRRPRASRRPDRAFRHTRTRPDPSSGSDCRPATDLQRPARQRHRDLTSGEIHPRRAHGSRTGRRSAGLGQARAPLPGAQQDRRPRRDLRQRDVGPIRKDRVVLEQRARAGRDRWALTSSTQNTACGLPTLTTEGVCSTGTVDGADLQLDASACRGTAPPAGSRPSRSAARPYRR